MEDIRKLARIQIVTIILFIFFKAIRPYFIKNDFPEFFKIFLLSFPNFCEAVVGTIVLATIGLVIGHKWGKTKFSIEESTIYLIATIVAAFYVILQEFKIHNLGGRNVYDPYDVLFSIFGLITAYAILRWQKPQITSF